MLGVMMNIKKRLKIICRGNVQGVGFRFAVNHLANHYDIGGFVRNEPDGSVLIVAEGGSGSLQSFIDSVESSHVGGYIREKSIEKEDYTGKFSGFSIEH